MNSRILFALFFIAFVGARLMNDALGLHQASNEQKWSDFKTKFGKVYSTSEEEEQRFRIFQNNLAAAEVLNRADSKATYGVTKFMDLSTDEFSKFYLMPKSVYANYTYEEGRLASQDFKSVDLPTSFDWRSKGAVTAVYNQGQCGSCWAFSATETIESYNELCGNGLNHEAMQQIVDCDGTSYGCNGGWTSSAYSYVIQAGGIEPLADYPYTAETGSCQFDKSKVNEKINSWSYVTQSADESVMENWCYSKGPLSVCVDAASWQYYTGGVITSCGSQIDHCVQVTGFSTQSGTPAWNVRNSWGTDWGNQGYLYVERGQNMCQIGSVVTAVTCSKN